MRASKGSPFQNVLNCLKFTSSLHFELLSIIFLSYFFKAQRILAILLVSAVNHTTKMFSMPQYEPPHDKTNRMACAPSEDSDQPGHPPSMIRVLAVCMKKAWVLSYQVSTQRILWSVIWLVLSWGDSYLSFFSSSLCHEIMVLSNIRPTKAQASLRIRLRCSHTWSMDEGSDQSSDI